MQKSALQALIEKSSKGDKTSIRKLVQKLCDRLVFVPIVESKSGSANTVKVSVIRVREGDRKIIPIFLTQQNLKRWLELTELKGESMSIYCSDICKALGLGNWLMVDGGAEYWTELDAQYADEIAQYEPQDEDDDLLEPQQWSMRESVAERTEPKPVPQEAAPAKEPQSDKTQEVSIQALSVIQGTSELKNDLNPSEAVAQFPQLGKMVVPAPAASSTSKGGSGVRRFRQSEDEDIRATMDLSSLRNRK